MRWTNTLAQYGTELITIVKKNLCGVKITCKYKTRVEVIDMSNTLAYFNTELITTVKIYFVSLKIACIYYTTNALAYYGHELITAI